MNLLVLIEYDSGTVCCALYRMQCEHTRMIVEETVVVAFGICVVRSSLKRCIFQILFTVSDVKTINPFVLRFVDAQIQNYLICLFSHEIFKSIK